MSFSKSVNCIDTSSIPLDVHNMYNCLDSAESIELATFNHNYKYTNFELFDKIITTNIYINVDESKLYKFT